MLRLQRSLLGDLFVVFVLALVLVTAVLFAGLSLQAMGQTQGLELRFLLTLLPSLLPTAVAQATPYAFLLAVALVYGRLVSDREFLAIRAAGIAPRTVAMPALALGAVLSVGALVATGWLVPAAGQAVRMQKRNLVDLFLGQIASTEGRINLHGCRFSFGTYAPAATPGGLGVFRDVQLDFRGKKSGELERMLIADEARLWRSGDVLHVDMPTAFVVEESPRGGMKVERREIRGVSVGFVESLGAAVAFNDLVGGGRFDRKERDVDLPDLLYLVARGDVPPKSFLRAKEGPDVPTKRALVELHGRLAGSLTPFLFGLVAVGVVFQLSPRSRRLTGFLLAFLPAAGVHFPLSVAGRSLAIGAKVPPAVGMWAADVVLLVGGLLLLRRATRR
jgi:lipopolysaccharide export LptBFGC system permease protein LptF